jgi:hypothetical protein
MKSKATNTEVMLFFIGFIFSIISLFTLNDYVIGLSIGILSTLNVIWYFSDIFNKKPERYTYKGNTYTFNYYCSFKHPENRGWVTAVNYSDKAGNKYIREVSEFNKLFINE